LKVLLNLQEWDQKILNVIIFLDGFLNFFGYYTRNQRVKRFFRFNGDKIKIKDFSKLANQMLKAPFVVKDKNT